MQICSNLHPEIVFSCEHCPMCGFIHNNIGVSELFRELYETIDDLNTIIKQQSAQIKALCESDNEAHK